jgi:hypothetical protein
MSYCAFADVASQFPHIPEDGWGTGNVPDQARPEEIIAENDQLIDSYLSLRFEVPFGPAPTSVARISRDLTVCDAPEPVMLAFCTVTGRRPQAGSPAPRGRRVNLGPAWACAAAGRA